MFGHQDFEYELPSSTRASFLWRPYMANLTAQMHNWSVSLRHSVWLVTTLFSQLCDSLTAERGPWGCHAQGLASPVQAHKRCDSLSKRIYRWALGCHVRWGPLLSSWLL